MNVQQFFTVVLVHKQSSSAQEVKVMYRNENFSYKPCYSEPLHGHCTNPLAAGVHGLNSTDNGIDPYIK